MKLWISKNGINVTEATFACKILHVANKTKMNKIRGQRAWAIISFDVE